MPLSRPPMPVWRRGRDVRRLLVLLTLAGLLVGACGGMHPKIQAPQDETPPAPPPPVLSAGATTSTSATVQWTAPDTAMVIAGYALRWRRDGDADWTMVADLPSASTEYTIPNLDTGTRYEVQVRARYAGEQGEWSHIVTVKTAPPPPVLAPGTRTATAVTVTWKAPETDSAITGYELHWRRDGDTDWTMATDLPSTPTEYTIPDLDAGAAYEIRVRARYAGEEGEWSLVVTVETAAPPPPTPAPRRPPRTPPIFEVAMVTATSITVRWTATDTAITHYDLWWGAYDSEYLISEVRVPSTAGRTYTINLPGGCDCLVASRTVSGNVVGEWFYLGAGTRAYKPLGPRISIVTDDAVYDEGDGAVEFILAPQDRVSEALTVAVWLTQQGSVLRRSGLYQVRVGAGSTKVRFRVGLEVDSVDEPDGWVFARIGTRITGTGPWYEFGDATAAIVKVRDDD